MKCSVGLILCQSMPMSNKTREAFECRVARFEGNLRSYFQFLCHIVILMVSQNYETISQI